MPYTAIQSILEDESDVYIGNAIATFATLAGGAISVSIGENLLVSKLISEVSKYTSTLSAQTVIEAGPLNLTTLKASPAVLTGLRKAYSTAISATMICATVTICVSILATFGMRRLNLREVSRDREVSKQVVQSSVAEKEEQGQEKELATVSEKIL